MKKKFWHELPQGEVDDLIAERKTNQYVVDNFLQPEWCSYPEALMGVMGCWSLTDNTPGGTRTIVSHEYCASCDCYRVEKKI